MVAATAQQRQLTNPEVEFGIVKVNTRKLQIALF